MRKRFRQLLGGRSEEPSSEHSEAAARERAAERAKRRAERQAAGPRAQRIRHSAAERLRSSAERGGPQAKKLLSSGSGALVEVGKLVREMLVIPAQLWLAVAEVAGRVVLGAWLWLLPVLIAAYRGARTGLGIAERRVRPLHGSLAVALAVIAVLVIAQWTDYRGVAVGTTEYSGGVELVAPAPEIDRERAGEAHAWVVLPIAAAALALVALAALGRRGLARLLVPLGLAVVAISLFIDLPNGLDEGTATIAYEGAEASLLEGFWAQIFAGGVLAACGLLLPIHLATAGAQRRRRERGGGRDERPAPRRSGPKAASA